MVEVDAKGGVAHVELVLNEEQSTQALESGEGQYNFAASPSEKNSSKSSTADKKEEAAPTARAASTGIAAISTSTSSKADAGRVFFLLKASLIVAVAAAVKYIVIRLLGKNQSPSRSIAVGTHNALFFFHALE